MSSGEIYMSRERFLHLGVGLSVGALITACTGGGVEMRPALGEISGIPTIYRQDTAESTARYNSGIAEGADLGLIPQIDMARDVSDVLSIRGLVENQKMYKRFAERRANDYKEITKRIVMGGENLPVLVAPQVCHWIPDGDSSKRRGFLWDDVSVVSDYEILADGTIQQRAIPLEVPGLIFDVHHGNCGQFKDFFSDMLARDVSTVYGISAGERSPYFRTTGGQSISRLPALRMKYYG